MPFSSRDVEDIFSTVEKRYHKSHQQCRPPSSNYTEFLLPIQKIFHRWESKRNADYTKYDRRENTEGTHHEHMTSQLFEKEHFNLSNAAVRTENTCIRCAWGARCMPFVSCCSIVRHNNLRRSYAFPSQIGHGYELRRSRDAIRVHIIRKNSEDVISNFRARSRDFVTRKLDFF